MDRIPEEGSLLEVRCPVFDSPLYKLRDFMKNGDEIGKDRKESRMTPRFLRDGGSSHAT